MFNGFRQDSNSKPKLMTDYQNLSSVHIIGHPLHINCGVVWILSLQAAVNENMQLDVRLLLLPRPRNIVVVYEPFHCLIQCCLKLTQRDHIFRRS